MRHVKKIRKTGKRMYKVSYLAVPESKELPYYKGVIRNTIQEEVFDIEDSVADNAKMISLLTSVVMRMWKVMPQDQKDLMDSEDVAVIDYFATAFDGVETNADKKFAVEGTNMIDKLLERQAEVGSIVENS